MPNTIITPPRVPLLDPRTNQIDRAWYRWLYNIFTVTGGASGITPIVNGGTGLGTIPLNGQLLIGNGTGYALNTLGYGAGISVTNGLGTITVANTGVLSNIAGAGIAVSGATGDVTIDNTGVLSWSGGTTGLTPSVAAYGDVVLAGALIAANGGTGFTSYSVGDLLYADTTTTLAKLPDVATGNALISGGVGVAPSWGKIGLTSLVTGTLPVANGGTGITSFGTGVATWLGTPSSANLAAAVTDETGSGALVFGTAPTISNLTVAGVGGNVYSDVYTPTQVSTNTNVDSVTFSECQYLRINNTVTVSGQIVIDATTATTDTVVKMSIPVASNFSATRNLGGTGASIGSPFVANVLVFIAETTNDCIEIRLRPSVNTAVTYNFSLTYRIQ